MRKPFYYLVLPGIATLGCHGSDKPPIPETTAHPVPVINYIVTARFAHDTTAYTEGLLVHDGQLYESTGASPGLPQTRSLFGVLDLNTGSINKKVELDPEKYFGEGIAFLQGKAYQLTYTTGIGFVYDASSFRKIGEFQFPSSEGWGMTTDGHSLIMSDGTSRLTYLDPNSFKTVRTVDVRDDLGPIDKLNELEFINGKLYSNVYTTSDIIQIDPASGRVTGKLDLSSLVNETKSLYPAAMELNGIAYDSVTHKTYITGKMWPKVYEIQFAN